jgi:parallel beta-helix repeat protein
MRVLVIFCAALTAASCGSSGPCSGVSGSCKSFSSGATEADISGAFASAPPNSTIAFGAGTFSFTNTLTLAASAGVTVKGAGAAQTILDFQGQTAGSEGIDVLDHSDGFKLQDLRVKDTKGDAVKVIGTTGVTFLNVTVDWTDPDGTKHGAYGLYPVQSKNVLIDGCTVSGASDAGIYVGQSDTIIVRNSTATGNVAGIEIENSFNADVTGNTSTGNTAGVLVFDLPGLQQQGGHNVRVFNNTITNNNKKNFAAHGDIVAAVPEGTGSFVMANHDVEVFGNTITGNNTTGFAVVSYVVTQLSFDPDTYDAYPSKVFAHDNTFSNNGANPDADTQLGLLLLSGGSAYPGNHNVPSILYDGIPDPKVGGAGTAGNPMQICFKNNGSATGYANLHLDLLNGSGTNLSSIVTTDATGVTCDLPALPAVTLP